MYMYIHLCIILRTAETGSRPGQAQRREPWRPDAEGPARITSGPVMVWYGMVWYGMVRYGMVGYGMVW